MPLIPKQQPPYYATEDLPTPAINVKKYVGLINQSGTSAPTITVLENSVGTVTPGYQTIGAYTLTGTFPVDKTICLIDNNNYYSTAMQSMYADGGTTIYITSEGWSGTDWEPLNDNMTNVGFTIIVYP